MTNKTYIYNLCGRSNDNLCAQFYYNDNHVHYFFTKDNLCT
jgi:hypothetical protein